MSSLRLLRRSLPTAVLCAFFLIQTSALQAAEAEQRQRQRFRLAYAAAQHGKDGLWQSFAADLKTYPLWVYVEAAALKPRLAKASAAEVQAFLARWPEALAANDVRAAYLRQQAKRGDWPSVLSLYRESTDLELRCHYLNARLKSAQALSFERDIASLWQAQRALPTACDPLLFALRAQGQLSDALLWERVWLAAEHGLPGGAGTLGQLLPTSARPALQRLGDTLSQPAATLARAANWPDDADSRRTIALGLERLARRSTDQAEKLWSTLSWRFAPGSAEALRVQRALAVYQATDFGPDALRGLSALPDAAHDDASREWLVRVALAAQDWAQVLTTIDAMPAWQRSDPRWRYYRGRALVKLGRGAEAEAALAVLAREANFYGFLAADWLRLPYAICPLTVAAGADPEHEIQRHPGLARAFEFFELEMLSQARREWDYALAGFSPEQRRFAADQATARGWHDRAVFALNAGQDLRLYGLRFPLARKRLIELEAQRSHLDPAFPYAIIRAESAWMPDARSSADAYGLMQLLPSTAARVARQEKLPYRGSADLLRPTLNIRLGTRYLARMAERYQGSPWLAAAAYNAGAAPVAKWLAARGHLEPDFFIETIPYKETREYVARVLAFSVIYDWRLRGDASALAGRMPRPGQAYTAPTAQTLRKAVVCPSANVAQRP